MTDELKVAIVALLASFRVTVALTKMLKRTIVAFTNVLNSPNVLPCSSLKRILSETTKISGNPTLLPGPGEGFSQMKSNPGQASYR